MIYRLATWAAFTALFLFFLELNELCAKEQSFLGANELRPKEAQPIIDQIPEGGTIGGVGTYRLFFDLLMAIKAGKQPTGIDVLDLDDKVLKFHRYHRAIVKAATHADMYEQMITNRPGIGKHNSFEAWGRAADLLATKNEGRHSDDVALLKDRGVYDWWHSEVIRSDDFEKMMRCGPTDQCFGNDGSHPFDELRFWHNDELYQPVREMIMTDRLHIHKVDLRDFSTVIKFIEDIDARGEFLALLDLSNVQETNVDRYLGEKTSELVANIAPRLRSQSILMFAQLWTFDSHYRIQYHGFSSRFLEQNPSWIELVQRQKLSLVKGCQYFDEFRTLDLSAQVHLL